MPANAAPPPTCWPRATTKPLRISSISLRLASRSDQPRGPVRLTRSCHRPPVSCSAPLNDCAPRDTPAASGPPPPAVPATPSACRSSPSPRRGRAAPLAAQLVGLPASLRIGPEKGPDVGPQAARQLRQGRPLAEARERRVGEHILGPPLTPQGPQPLAVSS